MRADMRLRDTTWSVIVVCIGEQNLVGIDAAFSAVAILSPLKSTYLTRYTAQSMEI